MAKVFVSYSRRDSVVARRIIEALNEIEQDVWVDWEDIPPAADWLEQIFRGIEGSEAFIFLISPDSVASEVCNVEVRHAAKNNKRIIPVVLREVKPDETNEIIRKLNWTFMREGDTFEDGIAKIKVAIELDLPWVEEHNRLQARALEWHRKKDVSLLLRGRDLRNAKQMIDVATSKDPPPTDLQLTYIQHSLRDERRTTNLRLAAIVTLGILAILSLFATIQRNLAVTNARVAEENRQRAEENRETAEDNRRQAEENERVARENEEIAVAARQAAEEARTTAEAQRSAARAQIFQTRAGELDTGTLLAIDSWQRSPSAEAEEILRKNISLLPIPVAQASQSGTINSLEYSPDGSTFVTASADATVCAWQAVDGRQVFCSESTGPVNDAAFSPDGSVIVTGDESGRVQILSVESGEVEDTFEFEAPVRDVSIRRDGRLLAAARDDGKISIVDLTTRRFSYNLQTFGSLNISTFSPNGLWLAVGSSTGSVTIWNLAEGKTIRGPQHQDGVLAIAFSPNSRYVVSGGRDSAVNVAETRSGRSLLRIANENWVRDIAFSPDGLWFVTASDDRRIRVWSTDSGRERLRMLQDGVVTDVKVSADGQWIATTGRDQTVRVWNAATGAEIFQIPLNATGSVLAFNKEGNAVAIGDQSGAIKVWDISSMAAPVRHVQFSGSTGNVQFSPSGERLAVSEDNRVWLLDPTPLSNLPPRPEGQPTLEFRSAVDRMVFSPDSRVLGLVTADNEVAVYRIETRGLRTIQPSGPVRAIAFSPDGLQFLTASSNGELQVWNAGTGQFIEVLVEGSEAVNSLATGPEHLAMNVAETIMIVDMLNSNGGQAVSELRTLGSQTLLAFSADGSRFASANSSGLINIWAYRDGEYGSAISLSRGQAVSMSFNPDGSLLVVGTADYAYLIESATGEEIARIPHVDAVRAVSFSGDGKILATASARAIQLWEIAGIQQVRKAELIQIACSRLTENFSRPRWTEFFEKDRYRTMCENLPVP